MNTRSTLISLFILFIAMPLQATQYRAVLEPHTQAILSSEVTSTVENIHKRMGESFVKDEVLITLDNTIFYANLLRAKALLIKAQADFTSMSALYQDKAISHSELREAEAALAGAEADVVIATKTYEDCTIKSPYDGKVIEVFIKEYERVQPGQKLIEILDDSTLIAKLLLPETYLSTLQIGDEIDLDIMETGQKHTATIVRIGTVIDPVSSLIKVDAEIENSQGILRSGMEGRFTSNEAVLQP